MRKQNFTGMPDIMSRIRSGYLDDRNILIYTFIFIFDLLNDAVSRSDYISSNDKIINQ
jgi:hypothetical protein